MNPDLSYVINMKIRQILIFWLREATFRKKSLKLGGEKLTLDKKKFQM